MGIDAEDFVLRSVSKPFITARTIMRAATPSKIPAIENMVITDTKTCFRRALR